jgi:hypothetical protein
MVVGNAIDRGVVGVEVGIVVLVREDQGLKMIAFFFVWLAALFIKIGLGYCLMLADDLI